jgi:nucleoid-associated protein YgaU
VRRVTIRRPTGSKAAPTDEEDVWVAPGSPAATAETAASITTPTGAPVRAEAMAASDEAARRFRPSRWIPAALTVLILGLGALFWGGVLPWQRSVDLSVPASSPAVDAKRPPQPAGVPPGTSPPATGSAAPPTIAAPPPPPTAPAAEPSRSPATAPADSPAPAAGTSGAAPPAPTTGEPSTPPAAKGTEALATATPPATSGRPADPPGPAATAPAPPSPPSMVAPSFDIARVGPDGRAVIAGRAAPGARVTLLDGQREVATVQADARGEWALIVDNPPLPPGAHDLQLVQRVDGREVARSERTITVVVPEAPTAGAAPAASSPTAAAAPSGTSSGPAPPTSGTPPAGAGASPSSGSASGAAPSGPLVVSTPAAGGPSTVLQTPGGTDALARSGALVLGAVDYDDKGRLTVSGKAPPGTVVRLYVDNQPVGEATAAADGSWLIQPGEAVATGRRTVRVDQIGPSGAVTSRLEVPFERMILARPGVVTIVRGDNLWNIARSRYGDGLRYTVIYEANKNQIRDPDLIYPGQVFIVPKSP